MDFAVFLYAYYAYKGMVKSMEYLAKNELHLRSLKSIVLAYLYLVYEKRFIHLNRGQSHYEQSCHRIVVKI